MKRSGFFLPTARLFAVLALISGPARSALGDEPAQAPPATPSLPTAPPAAGDSTSPGAAPLKPAGVSVAQMLRDTSALRALVMRKSPQVAAADARITQARADVGTAGLLQNPQLGVTLGGITVGDTNPKGLGFGDTAYIDTGISEQFEIGKRGPRTEAATARLESAKALAQATTSDAVGDAREALGKVAYYAARSALLEQGASSAREGAKVENAKMQKGGTAGVDYDRLSLEVLALEAEASRGKTELASALATCQALLHQPCDETGAGEADLDASADVPGPPASGDSVESRPDIVAIRKEAEASRAEVDLAHAKAIPDPTIRLGYTRDQLVVAGNQPNLLSVSVSIPLPIFDHGQYDAAKASARATEMDHTAQAAALGAASDVTSLRARTTYLEKAVGTMKKDAIPKAESVVKVTEKAFAEGQVGLTDLLLARRAYLGLRLSQIDLSYEHFTARSALRRALGVDTSAR